MLLVFDIGNTQTEIGLFAISSFPSLSGNVLCSFRVNTKKDWTEDEFILLVVSLFSCGKSEYSPIEDKVAGIICSSVVPTLDKTIFNACKKCFNQEVLFVCSSMDLGISFDYPNPLEIGADRLVNAVCAKELYGMPLIIIDFGTSTTYCVVSDKGEYLGGIIAPGIRLSLDALTTRAEKLFYVDLNSSSKFMLLGKSTREAVKSGVYFSAIASLEGIVKRLVREFNLVGVKVIATGGFASMIYEGTRSIDILDTRLILKGLEILFHRNK